MNTEIRTSVWEGMVEADRLHRYYGKLAGKLGRRDHCMTVATCLLALLTAGLASRGNEWTLTVAIVTAVAGALPLIYRLGDRITEAAYCGRQLSDLSVRWRELWNQVDSLPEDEVAERWRKLAVAVNEVTALKERVPADEKLLGATEEESYAYWRTKTDQASTSTASTAVARA